MDSPTSPPAPQSETSPADSITDALTQNDEIGLQLEGDSQTGKTCGYSLLIQGEVQSSSILSSTDPAETITLLEDNKKLLSGSLSGETDGFILDGTILAAEFDEPAPAVKINGSYIDVQQWPTVKEYTGHGAKQEPVEDPFPNSGELGGSPNDPLDPTEYLIELDANGLDKPAAFCFDIDGAVITRSEEMTVPDSEDRVYGCLSAGESAEVAVRGVITRIDTADGIEFTVRARDAVQQPQAE